MLYAQPHGDYALSELAVELRNAQPAPWYRRLKIIQLSMRGAPVPELAAQFAVCPATVRSYLKA